MKENCIERMERIKGSEKIASFITKQKESYEYKTKYAEIRAKEFVRECDSRGLNYHVSVGGLDSIVLFLFLRHIGIDAPGISVSYLEDASIQKIHRQLGLELLVSAARSDGTRWNKGRIIQEFGFPVLSKEIASKIELLANATEKNKTVRHAIVTGETGEYGGYQKNSRMKLSQKWLEKFGGYANEECGTDYQTPDFKVSSKCCYYLKEKPCDDWAREHNSVPFLGLMASEGGRRAKSLMINGCNYFGKSVIRSAPFAIFNRQDILQLAIDLKVPVPEIYGSIEQAPDGTLYTTKAQRTGCSMCGFGIHLEKRPHRFDQLRERSPKEWHYWMYECYENKDTGEIFGWGHVLDYIGVAWEDKIIPQEKEGGVCMGNEVITTPAVTDKTYKEHVKKIADALASVKKAFFKIAFALEWIDRTQAYQIDGYRNIAEFAEQKYGIGKTSAYNYLNVARRFGKRDESGDIAELADTYKHYSPTQLIILYESGMSDDTIQTAGISPDMTCANIKAAIKSLKDAAGIPAGTDGTQRIPEKNPDRTSSLGNTVKSPDMQEDKADRPQTKKYSKTNSLLIIESIDELEKQKSEILNIIKKTLMQKGIKCAVSINMEWN